jgi:hypothetical protein
MKSQDKPRFSCWGHNLKQHTNRLAKKFDKKPTRIAHGNRLISLLCDIAGQYDERFNGTHTRILEKYPGIPVLFFALLTRAPYRVGLKVYKEWHKERGIKPPLTGRTSAEARAKWLQVVLEEIVTK